MRCHLMPFVTYTRSLTKDVGLEKKDEMTVSQRAAEYAINSCCMKTLFIVSFFF